MIIAGANTAWYVGLTLGFVVVAITVLIVMVILTLAAKIADQATTAAGAVEVVRAQTTSLSGGVGKVNSSAVRILHTARALRKAAVGT